MEEYDLNDFRKKIFSQYEQDGIIEKIFEIIGTTNKYFVEFGSYGTPEGMGNTAYLRRFGFDGLLMEASNTQNSIYEVKKKFIKPSNINSLFEKYNVPNEFDFLSIDIDGQDFNVWNSIDLKYKPRVVSIEFNPHILHGYDRTMKLDDEWVWGGDDQFGSSVTALKKLGNHKGYYLVNCCVCDLFFIRKDIIDDNKIKIRHLNDDILLQKDNDLFSPYVNHYREISRYDKPNFWHESDFFINKN